MFGGIEAEKNSSLESLENVQKKIFKAMERAQQTYKKIYQAANSVKENLLDLSDNYLSLTKTNKHSGKLINKLQAEINELFQKISEESIAFSKKMESKADSYAPNFKKLKEKYTECADTLEHYKQKVVLLRKNVEKQSLAKIKQDEHERYERVHYY
jgi:chromosome segregation ATPase